MRRKVVGILVVLAFLAVPLASCASFTAEDEKYVGLVKLYLAEFGQLQNDLNTLVAKATGNPGILKVDETFRKECRACVMTSWALLNKIGDLKPGKTTKDAHRMLQNAAELYQVYFTEILVSLDNWTPETPTTLIKMSGDANVTLSTYLTRLGG